MRPFKEAIYLLIIAMLIATSGQFYYTYRYKPTSERNVTVYYNKNIEANKKIIDVIENADHFVYFAIYTFTREDIKDAIVGAKIRGLDVRGIIDRNQSNQISSQKKIVKELKDAGIPIATQNHSAIMHVKTVVTEKAYVTGSYNWTKSATEVNDEVLEVGFDENLRKQYENVILEIINKYAL